MRNAPDDLAVREDLAVSQALRDGLRALPVPAVAADFDARVLAGLCAPLPWWRRWWQPAKPLLAGASFSLVVTLLGLHWILAAPMTMPAAPFTVSPPSVTASSAPAPSVDALLYRPDLSAGSLAMVWYSPPVAPTAARRPEPRRHAQISRRSCPVA